MKVKISDLSKIMRKSLTNRGLTKSEAAITTEPFIEAELSGKKTHGISKFLLIDEAIKKREKTPEIIYEKFNYTKIDAHKELGYISAQFATDILIKKTKRYGNASVAVVNSYYYSMLNVYARKVAKAGFLSIILNNGGPAAVVPFGGTDPILGTNPIAIGIPTKTEPIVLDMATSERPWGAINLAKVENKKLQKNIFFDSDGSFTTDPQKAVAIAPFGGYKGYGLNFAFEILTGAFVGAKMGLQSKGAYDLGFFFMAFSPEMFTTRKEFDNNMSQLIREVKNSERMKTTDEIYLPGEQSARRLRNARIKGYVEMEDSTWNALVSFSERKNVKGKLNLVE